MNEKALDIAKAFITNSTTNKEAARKLISALREVIESSLTDTESIWIIATSRNVPHHKLRSAVQAYAMNGGYDA